MLFFFIFLTVRRGHKVLYTLHHSSLKIIYSNLALTRHFGDADPTETRIPGLAGVLGFCSSDYKHVSMFDVDDDADNIPPFLRPPSHKAALERFSSAPRLAIPIRWAGSVRNYARSLVGGVPGGSRCKYAGVDHGNK